MNNEFYVGWGTLALINAGSRKKQNGIKLVSAIPVVRPARNPVSCSVS